MYAIRSYYDAKVTYYDYDITTGEKEILSPEVGFGIASIDTENIMPYKDDYIYFTDYKVMSYNKGDYKELLDYSDAGFKYGASRRGRVSEELIYLGRITSYNVCYTKLLRKKY